MYCMYCGSIALFLQSHSCTDLSQWAAWASAAWPRHSCHCGVSCWYLSIVPRLSGARAVVVQQPSWHDQYPEMIPMFLAVCVCCCCSDPATDLSSPTDERFLLSGCLWVEVRAMGTIDSELTETRHQVVRSNECQKHPVAMERSRNTTTHHRWSHHLIHGTPLARMSQKGADHDVPTRPGWLVGACGCAPLRCWEKSWRFLESLQFVWSWAWCGLTGWSSTVAFRKAKLQPFTTCSTVFQCLQTCGRKVLPSSTACWWSYVLFALVLQYHLQLTCLERSILGTSWKDLPNPADMHG